MIELKTLGKIGIWIGIGVTAYIGMLGGIGGTAYANLTRPELIIALTAVPVILASHIWRPMFVSILAVGLSIPAASGIMAATPNAPVWPFAVVLIAIDFLAIRYAFRKEDVDNRSLDLEAIGDIVRLVGNGAAYGLIADRLNACSQHFIGEGRTRFWLVNSSQGEISLVPTGEAAVMARLPGQGKYTGTRLTYPLDATLASAKAATSGETVDVDDVLASGPDLLMSREQAQFDGFRTILALPLFSRGQVTGVLSYETAQKGRRQFTKVQRQNLRTLAAVATLALNDTANHQE